jgi:hypothetical protein
MLQLGAGETSMMKLEVANLSGMIMSVSRNCTVEKQLYPLVYECMNALYL